jgi:hypothetical protein|nr:MAG TPA: hypothetical protein [Caudoviricetes sp.]
MSNYVWKQVESIRQDMVSVLQDSGFKVMLTPRILTIRRGNEKVVEVNTKCTAPKELWSLADDNLYYRQQIAMMMTAMNAVIYLKSDIASAVKDKAHRAFGLYVKMTDYLREHPTVTQMTVYSDEELLDVGEKHMEETETEIYDNRPQRFTDTIFGGDSHYPDIRKPHVAMTDMEDEPEKPKEVEVTDKTVAKYCNKVMEALDDVAWKHSDITYKWEYNEGPYNEDNIPCLWFTVKFGGAKYKFKYTLPLDKWTVLQNHTEKFVEERGLDKSLTKKLIKTVLVRMGLDYLFSNVTIVDEVTAKVTKDNIRKARKVIESDIGTLYMPYGKFNTIFTHDVSNEYTVNIANR